MRALPPSSVASATGDGSIETTIFTAHHKHMIKQKRLQLEWSGGEGGGNIAVESGREFETSLKLGIQRVIQRGLEKWHLDESNGTGCWRKQCW